ncbi:unnamed protein product [Echinostoma caproni]|uniref:HisKA domain-containing protein n=1 Tax=Echinostoma caproni TaxID=27848 RepID=A0A183AYI2_9TREM|nr:unnamed protein product [Echinostoma caproni]
MFYLQTFEKIKPTSNVEMRLLCHTILLLLARTVDRVGAIADQRSQSVARIQVRQTFCLLLNRLELATASELAASVQTELQRMRLALNTAVDRMNKDA